MAQKFSKIYMQMTDKIEHLREARVLQKTKTATKWLEWKLLMVYIRSLN